MKYFYANVCDVHAGPVDFQLVFGLRFPRMAGQEAEEIMPQKTVCMSPQHAKSLLNLLAQIVGGWEVQHGEIRLPEGFNRMMN